MFLARASLVAPDHAVEGHGEPGVRSGRDPSEDKAWHQSDNLVGRANHCPDALLEIRVKRGVETLKGVDFHLYCYWW